MRNPSTAPLISGYTCRTCKARLRRSAEQFLLLRPQRQASTVAQANRLLPERPARTRFAPSPTGNLHLGSIRTALFNYLLARRTKGQFLLRIEDTDQKRTIPGAEQQLCKDLQWAGLQWDEGPGVGGLCGPYRQSERTQTYRERVSALLETEHAYRCFCSPERLDNLNRSRHQRGLPLGYDRKCAHLSLNESNSLAKQGEGHVVRLKAPEKHLPWYDMVYGSIGKSKQGARKYLVDDAVHDDPVLLKSDGNPTYHLANVVDDHLMKITHVIRGSEWMSSTPLHLSLYKAFGWEPPLFAHVPLLVDQKNQKLSKRNLDTDISSFRGQREIFPQALVNFTVLLGWSHQQKSDLLPLRRLEEVFDMKFTKGNTVVSLAKLQFLQERYARQYIADAGEHFHHMVKMVSRALLELCEEREISPILGGRSLEDVVSLLLQADSKSYSTATDFARRCANLFKPTFNQTYEPLNPETQLAALRTVTASLLLVPSQLWTADTHRENLAAILPPSTGDEGEDIGSASSLKALRKELYRFLRWALMGGASGPPLPDLMEIMGRDVCVGRIHDAIRRTLVQEQDAELERADVQPLAATQ